MHGPALAAHPGVALAGFLDADRRGERARGAIRGRAHRSFDDLADAVDVVALAVPPAVQGGPAVRAAAAGRHLICEKPLAATVAEAREVVDAVRRAGVVSSVVLTMRHDPGVRAWLASLPDGSGHRRIGPLALGRPSRWALRRLGVARRARRPTRHRPARRRPARRRARARHGR